MLCVRATNIFLYKYKFILQEVSIFEKSGKQIGTVTEKSYNLIVGIFNAEIVIIPYMNNDLYNTEYALFL